MAGEGTRRFRIAAWGLGSLVVLTGLATYAAAPSPTAICEHLFALARETEGEAGVADVTMARCEESYEARRTHHGKLRFTVVAWCVRISETLTDAGSCG